MGCGDQLMATGMARGAKARGKRIAFGDGRKLIWDKHSAEMFRGNPNIAGPGSEHHKDVEWVRYYKGLRIYNTQHKPTERWVWNHDFKPIPGELFFDEAETKGATRYGEGGFVLIEPNVEAWKTAAPNKVWPKDRYQAVADELRGRGYRVAQFSYPTATVRLAGVEQFATRSFRDAAAILGRAALFIGPEGGLHHAAAAVGTNAVVLFGGFIPPSVTGYDGHANLTGGAQACGRYTPCDHCRQAMAAIAVEDVLAPALERLS
jgi:ADP-heptose:LPS heptosyltransferase